MAAALTCLPEWFTAAFAVTGAGYLVVTAFLLFSGREANRVARTFANETETTP